MCIRDRAWTVSCNRDARPLKNPRFGRKPRFLRPAGARNISKKCHSIRLWAVSYTHLDVYKRQVLDSPAVADCVSRGEEVTLTVVGENEGQSMRLLAGLEGCAAGRKNTFCLSLIHI